MRRARVPYHMGIIIGPRLILHTEKNLNSIIEDYTSSRLYQSVMGTYRYKS